MTRASEARHDDPMFDGAWKAKTKIAAIENGLTRDRVIQAIGLRKTLELMWVRLLGGIAGFTAVTVIWRLARWSNTF